MEPQDTTQVLQSLHDAGIPASEWKKDSYHRVYVNRLAGLYGLQCEYYNTGNISHAAVRGEVISNGRARQLSYALSEAKLWWDAEDRKWHASAASTDMANELVALIKAKLA